VYVYILYVSSNLSWLVLFADVRRNQYGDIIEDWTISYLSVSDGAERCHM